MTVILLQVGPIIIEVRSTILLILTVSLAIRTFDEWSPRDRLLPN